MLHPFSLLSLEMFLEFQVDFPCPISFLPNYSVFLKNDVFLFFQEIELFFHIEFPEIVDDFVTFDPGHHVE